MGLCYRDADRRVAASPDGLVLADGRGVELKCPFMLKRHWKHLAGNCVPTEYVMQVQAAFGSQGWTVGTS